MITSQLTWARSPSIRTSLQKGVPQGANGEGTPFGNGNVGMGWDVATSAPLAGSSWATRSAPVGAVSVAASVFRWTPGCPLAGSRRSEEHTSELQSLAYLVCRLLLEKKKKRSNDYCY